MTSYASGSIPACEARTYRAKPNLAANRKAYSQGAEFLQRGDLIIVPFVFLGLMSPLQSRHFRIPTIIVGARFEKIIPRTLGTNTAIHNRKHLINGKWQFLPPSTPPRFP